MAAVVSLPDTNATQVDTVRSESEPRHKDIVHLWEFLLELLADESCGSIITWITQEKGEFKLKNPEQVAKLWGAYKGVKGMNYEKLSRALRSYYSKGIIAKLRSCLIKRYEKERSIKLRPHCIHNGGCFEILNLIQIPGQMLVYRFGKLPYKYEPGVTRSRRYGHRIKACIQRHMPQSPSSSRQKNPGPLSWSFFPVSTRLRKSYSWPLIPKPSHSISWYPVPTPHTHCSKSRIFFPPFEESSFPGSGNEVVFAVDPMTSTSLSSPVSFAFNNPIECSAPVVKERNPRATSIAVPVIKWI